MQIKSKKELAQEIIYSLMDLENEELVKIAERIISREVKCLSEDTFDVGSGEFQVIKERVFKEESETGYTLDGRRIRDGSRLIIILPDNFELEVIVECDVRSDVVDILSFVSVFHGIQVSVPIKVGMKAKWVD